MSNVKFILLVLNGYRTIFNKIIAPLTNIWLNGQVLDSVKDHLVIFKPKVNSTHLVYFYLTKQNLATPSNL